MQKTSDAAPTLAELSAKAGDSLMANARFMDELLNAYRAGRLREVPPMDAEMRRMTYAERNPFGGPATRFEAVASRANRDPDTLEYLWRWLGYLRAGDDYTETLRDFGLADLPGDEYICKCGIRVIPHRCPTGSDF